MLAYANQARLLFLFLCWKICNKKILLVAEPSGLGDYIYVRPIFKIIKNSNKYGTCKCILIGTSRWKDFAIDVDGEFCDGFIWLDNPYKPRMYETLALKFFVFDYFVNFRHYEGRHYWERLQKIVKAKKLFHTTSYDNESKIYGYYEARFFNMISKMFDECHYDEKWFQWSPDYSLISSRKIFIPDSHYIVVHCVGYSQGVMLEKQIKAVLNAVNLFENETKKNLKVIFIGSTSDEKKLGYLFSKNNSNIINACGMYRISELSLLLKKADAFVAIDSGISHMAVTLGIPLLILGSRRPDLPTPLHFSKGIMYLIDDYKVQNIDALVIKNAVHKLLLKTV